VPKKTSPASLSAEERRIRSRLHQVLSQTVGFLRGSLIEMARRCGNPRCRCASDDANKHRSLYLGYSHEGKTTMQYIPKDLEQTVRRWAGDFQIAATLLEELSQQGRRRLNEAKANARAGKDAAKKKAAKKKAAKKKAAKKKAAKKKAAKKKKKPPHDDPNTTSQIR
jgi:hypothetical protein